MSMYKARQRNQYPFDSYSDICYDGQGVGCDSCGCPCHGAAAPNFTNYQQVIDWHDPAYTITYTEQGITKTETLRSNALDRLSNANITFTILS